jgi:hypothetical protein
MTTQVAATQTQQSPKHSRIPKKNMTSFESLTNGSCQLPVYYTFSHVRIFLTERNSCVLNNVSRPRQIQHWQCQTTGSARRHARGWYYRRALRLARLCLLLFLCQYPPLFGNDGLIRTFFTDSLPNTSDDPIQAFPTSGICCYCRYWMGFNFYFDGTPRFPASIIRIGFHDHVCIRPQRIILQAFWFLDLSLGSSKQGLDQW